MLRGAVTGLAMAIAALPGGSNFDWYRVDRPGPGVCVREPYGVIPNFDVPAARAQIEAELAQMAAAGQRRLRIGIFHGRGLDTGTIMDSAGGDLSPRNRGNLAALLHAVKAAGFSGIEVAFHPQGPSLDAWTHWDESRFQENWHVIRHLRPIIRAAGLPYRIDLSNEAIPGPGQPLLLEYTRRLWRLYTRAFGRDDTVGFSVIGDPARIRRIPEVYGGGPPYTFDLHFYGDERAGFTAADGTARQLGLQQPWIVGEAFYDDTAAAQQLHDAIAGTQRRVYHLTQWPLTRGSDCADVDVAAPVAFDAYAAHGFDPLPDAARAAHAVLVRRTLRIDRRGTVRIPIRCRDTTTRCYGTVALRGLHARRFSAYAGRTASVRVRLPRRHRSAMHATAALTVRSEDSTATTRRAVAIVLVSS
jgi:hypothetical protein